MNGHMKKSGSLLLKGFIAFSMAISSIFATAPAVWAGSTSDQKVSDASRDLVATLIDDSLEVFDDLTADLNEALQLTTIGTYEVDDLTDELGDAAEELNEELAEIRDDYIEGLNQLRSLFAGGGPAESTLELTAKTSALAELQNSQAMYLNRAKQFIDFFATVKKQTKPWELDGLQKSLVNEINRTILKTHNEFITLGVAQLFQ